MATLTEIRQTAYSTSTIDTIRKSYLTQLYEHTQRATVVYASDFTDHSSQSSICLEDMQSFMSVFYKLKGKELDLILHSPGGSIDAADQIVQYIRRKFEHIRVIVPQNAMSAATMIACAADEIIMGKASALGPTDPQVGGLSAHSILSEFERAKKEIKQDPANAPLWITRISNLSAGLLDHCERAIQLSKERVREWLLQYMFSGANNAEDKAKKTAAWLADANKHKTHGRPLGIEVLKEQGLKVTPLEDDQTLQELVLSVFHSVIVTFETSRCVKLIENSNGLGAFLSLQKQ